MQNWVSYLSGEFFNHWAMGYSGAGVSQSCLLKLFSCVEIIKYALGQTQSENNSLRSMVGHSLQERETQLQMHTPHQSRGRTELQVFHGLAKCPTT